MPQAAKTARMVPKYAVHLLSMQVPIVRLRDHGALQSLSMWEMQTLPDAPRLPTREWGGATFWSADALWLGMRGFLHGRQNANALHEVPKAAQIFGQKSPAGPRKVCSQSGMFPGTI